MKLEIARAALMELRAAASWYEAQRAGLGDAFLDAVDRAFIAVTSRPRSFPLWAGSRIARKATVERFPYLVVFAIRNADTLRVLAVAHARRRPGYWKHRR